MCFLNVKYLVTSSIVQQPDITAAPLVYYQQPLMQTQNVNPIQENSTCRPLPIQFMQQSVPSNAMLIDQSNNLQHLSQINQLNQFNSLNQINQLNSLTQLSHLNQLNGGGGVCQAPQNPQFNNRSGPFSVELVDKGSWESFYDTGNEMIITKCGRRTFPYFAVRLTGLASHVKYSIQIGLEQINPIRWKYTDDKGWAPSKHEVYEPQSHYVEHVESGKSGEFLEGKVLSFKYIKLTNHPTCKETHFLLKSMHLYNFRVIIAAVLPGNIYCVVHNSSFDQTCFFAVTAYQNKLITRLKIERNPYAKGFLAQEQAKSPDNDAKESQKIRVSESDPDFTLSQANNTTINSSADTSIELIGNNNNVDFVTTNGNADFVTNGNLNGVDFTRNLNGVDFTNNLNGDFTNNLNGSNVDFTNNLNGSNVNFTNNLNGVDFTNNLNGIDFSNNLNGVDLTNNFNGVDFLNNFKGNGNFTNNFNINDFAIPYQMLHPQLFDTQFFAQLQSSRQIIPNMVVENSLPEQNNLENNFDNNIENNFDNKQGDNNTQ